MNPRYSYLANNFILLDENVPNNGKPEAGLFKIVDRDNTPRRPGLIIRSEYRGANSRIPLALSDPQVVRGIAYWGYSSGAQQPTSTVYQSLDLPVLTHI
jgi:hypothetical protein